MTRSRLVLAAVTLLCLFLTYAEAQASYSPVHLRRCVEEAATIAAGTVVSITPMRSGEIIFSVVAMDSVLFLRRPALADSHGLSFRLCGGSVDSVELICSENPELRVSESYVLFLQEGLGTPRDAYTTIVFLNQGLFPVFVDSTSPVAAVHDWIRRPIIGASGGRIISVSWFEPPQGSIPKPLTVDALAEIASKVPQGVPVIEIPRQMDPGIRLTEEQFLEEVRRLMKE